MIPWVTVWGYGAEIKSTRDSLLVRQKGTLTQYPLDDMRHLLIAGGHTLHTSVLERLADRGIAVSFFTAHGKPVGGIYGKGAPSLAAQQRDIPVHKFAMASIRSSLDERLRYINELAEFDPEGLYFKGEFDILNAAREELEYLITLPEIGRAFSLTKTMYYEIIGRKLPKVLGYRRRSQPPFMDPVNVMMSHGYAVLYANFAVACTGAGLDLSRGALYGEIVSAPGGRGGCVLDLMEPATVSMVDRVIIRMAAEGCLDGAYEVATRCLLSNELKEEFMKRLHGSINTTLIAENVNRYAESVKDGRDIIFHY